MIKDEIMNEIRRIAEMDGKPPGQKRFQTVSGLAKTKWFGVHWAKWSGALSDAGFTPNKKASGTQIDVLGHGLVTV
ncbi:MAG: hypothetical protein L3J30_13830 [Marinosulfonomonas sp.]|nr:hypothetical protein [Marinosulfonomonas sp.]